jgi:PAS domain S-box-containing protein
MQVIGEVFKDVLIVEDEAAHALVIERALCPLVGSITRVDTVTEGQKCLNDRAFDLIISDLNLPDFKCETAVSALRIRAPKTPLLVLTSSSSLNDGVAAMRAGANDFMVKNFDSSFPEVLNIVLSRLRTAQEAENERQQATRDRDLLREAIENSNDGLAVVLRNGRVRYCNSGFSHFLKIFGVESFDIRDIPTASIVRGEEILEKIRENLKALAPGEVWTTEMTQTGDSEGAYELSVSASRDPGTEQPLVLWVRDIHEKKRREHFQRELLSTTTHDLKGPLGAIAVSCDVLLDAPNKDDRSHALVERIATSANSAINLIEQFLSMRRIEEGAFVMRPVLTPVASLVRQVVESFSLTAKTRGLRVELVIEDDQILGCVDALGFERVLTNLYSNAVKFSKKGGIIEISLERHATGVSLKIRDYGAGMEPGDAKRLFQRYSRLSEHTAVSGSGLGLFIVKCIVSAHGGSIDVRSAIGKGTTFEVFFPDAPPRNDRGEVLCLDLG